MLARFGQRPVDLGLGRRGALGPCDPDLAALRPAWIPAGGIPPGPALPHAAVHGLLTRERAEHLDYRVGDDQSGVVGLRRILERYRDDGVGLVAERHGVPDGAPERHEPLRDPVTRPRSVLPRGADGQEVR